MESREDIPRVSVGSVNDWQKVRANYKDAALSLLRERTTASRVLSQEQDSIIAHLDQFIERMFNLAQPSLRVNGTNFESLDESGRETDPFDETLDRRIWSLADTRLQWHKRIAQMRRSVPAEIESTVVTLLERHRELDTTLLPVGPEVLPQDESNAEEDILRQQRIEQALRNTSILGNELEQTISHQQQRGDLAKIVAAEVKSLRP